MSNEDQGVSYGNIGVLDIRAADEAALRGIRRIGNLGVLVHGPDNAALVNTLSIGNIGCAVAAPAHYRLEMAPVRFDATALRGRSEPLGMIIMGPVTVDADVSAEDIEQGIERLFVMGPVICPDNLMAALRSKTEQQMGPVKTLSCRRQARLDLRITEVGSRCARRAGRSHSASKSGRLIVPDALPRGSADTQDSVAQRLQVGCCATRMTRRCCALLWPHPSGRFTLLPAGCKVIERALAIDSTFLRFSATPKMYVDGRITVDPAVTAEEIDQNLQELRCAGMILAPASLRDSLAPKCDLERDQVLFYDGTLWLEEGSAELTTERFAYLDGVATLLVEGVVTIHEAVDPALLMERPGQGAQLRGHSLHAPADGRPASTHGPQRGGAGRQHGSQEAQKDIGRKNRQHRLPGSLDAGGNGRRFRERVAALHVSRGWAVMRHEMRVRRRFDGRRYGLLRGTWIVFQDAPLAAVIRAVVTLAAGAATGPAAGAGDRALRRYGARCRQRSTRHGGHYRAGHRAGRAVRGGNPRDRRAFPG